MEKVAGRSCLQAEKDRLTRFGAVRLASRFVQVPRLLALLTMALFSAGRVRGDAEHVVDTRDVNTTNVTLAAVRGQPDSLESAWAEALTSARLLRDARNHAEASRKEFSAADSTRFPGTEGGNSKEGGGTAAVVSLPGLPAVSVETNQPLWAGRMTAVLPLFAGAPIGVAAAKAARQAAQSEECRRTLDLKLRVAGAYVRYCGRTRAARVAAGNAACLVAYLQTASDLYGKGAGANPDLRAAQVRVAGAREGEIQARHDLDLAATAYNSLLHRPLTRPVALQDLRPAPASGDVNELTAVAFQERPELIALARQTEALRQEARRAGPSAVPSLGVSGGYSHLDTSALQRDYIWSLGLVVTWNVFDNKLLRQHASAVERRVDAVAALRAKVMKEVSSQVRQASLEVSETRGRLEITTEAVVQAEEKLKVARDHYHNGTGANTEVFDAETLRLHCLGDHDNAVYDAVMAVFRLRHAVGDL